MFKKAIVIFSGYNQRAIISFCRVAEEQNIPLIIIARSEDDSILKTEYEKYVKYIREKIELDLSYIKNILSKIKNEEIFNEYVILPSSEALNRFLLNNKEELEELDFIIPLVDKQIYNLISDKYSFSSLCISNQIKVPEELSFNEEFNLPIVVKSKEYFTSDGKIISPQIIKQEIELSEFINSNNVDDFYIQDYIDGESYYLLYYFCKDGSYRSFSQKNILQQSKGKSIVAAIPSNIHEKEISNKFIELFKSINFTGLVMVEIKYFNKEYYMIEANPRLWGPSQLFVDYGCKFFELFLKDWEFDINIDELFHPKTNTKYFWFGGILESLCKFDEVVFHVEDFNSFIDEFSDFLLSDVYLREDTINVFSQEMLSLKGDFNYGKK